MIYIKTFEKFKGIKKTKKIRTKDANKGGVDAIMGGIIEAKANLNSLMGKLCKRFCVKKVKYMNSGAYGMAFIADKTKVIKLTSSSNEAGDVKKIIGKKIPGCVEYYDVVFYKKYGLYAVLMDRADDLTKIEKLAIDILLEVSSQITDYTINRVISETEMSKTDIKSLNNEVRNLKKDLEKNDVSTDDLHIGNMGRVNGKLVHFDIMSGYTGVDILKKISKFK